MRTDLSIGQQAVQAGHALSSWTLKYPDTWNNEYLLYLGVKNREELEMWIEKLISREEKFEIFHEPDLNNEPTAISLVSDGKLFKRLKLIG